MYIDGQYAFATAHLHGVLYRERKLLPSAGKTIENKEQLLAYWGLYGCQKVNHCPLQRVSKRGIPRGPKKQDSRFSHPRGSPRTSRASTNPGHLAQIQIARTPKLNTGRNSRVEKEEAKQDTDGQWSLPGERHAFPAALRRQMVAKLHQATHSKTSRTFELLRHRYYIPQLNNLVKDIVFRCSTCVQVKPNGEEKPPGGICAHGSTSQNTRK